MKGGFGSRLAPASFGAAGWAMAFTALIFVVDGTQTASYQAFCLLYKVAAEGTVGRGFGRTVGRGNRAERPLTARRRCMRRPWGGRPPLSVIAKP